MTELSEEQEQEVAAMLNTMEPETVNLLALDRKYDKQWYAEQLCNLRQIDEYFKEVGRVMEMCGRRDAMRAVEQRRSDLGSVMSMYEQAIKDLEDNDREYGLC